MKTNDKYIHPVDFSSADLSDAFKTLHPTVYRDGDAYCCISGANPVEGLFGCGNSPEEAIEEWEKTYVKKHGV